jgi:hypothetical protein
MCKKGFNQIYLANLADHLPSIIVKSNPRVTQKSKWRETLLYGKRASSSPA